MPTPPLNIPTRRNRSATISSNFGWPISSTAIYGTSPPSSSFSRRFSGSWVPTIAGSPPGQSSAVHTDSTQATNNTAANATVASSSPTDVSTPPHIHCVKTLSTVTFTTPLSSSIPAYSTFTRSKSTHTAPTRASTAPSSTRVPDDDDHHHHHHHHHKDRLDTVKRETAVLNRPDSPMRNAILTGQFLD